MTMHLSVALDGAGWHPAAWREPRARPAELLSARYWADVVAEAERGLLDFVTIEDGLSLRSSRRGEPDTRTDQVRGRLDAVLIAARVAPLTRHIGLMPTVIVTHTEPFHISKAIATLDYVSNGRAGVRVRVSGSPAEAAHFGRRDVTAVSHEQLFDEAADYVEVIRRLWDSWEDDAEIRDAATGRFLDRDKVHYIDFAGDFFSVKGPSITPRPPQGQPLVGALGHAAVPYELIARAADVGFVTPHDVAEVKSIVDRIHAAAPGYGREPASVRVFADIVVFLGSEGCNSEGPGSEGRNCEGHSPEGRKARLDEVAGEEFASDAAVFTGSPAELADLLQEWHEAGISGFRLRPGVIPDDLEAITRELVPELQRRGAFRTSYEAGTLRGLLGLPRPANRYATAAVGGNRS
jgi:alkanesulfonate monooxygenase SsuD/methylene tetrahydromethanopterin reductase-like flavin-dependent oxidoreductase (luciferase family)